MQSIIRKVPFVLLVSLLAACSEEVPPQPEVKGTEPASAPAAEPAPEQEAQVEEASTGELAGTSWQLVKIMSMDDSTDLPDDPSQYTLAFGADGGVSLQADCNRGSGSWSSEAPGQLQFGMIAATQAMCPPGSLHDRYLAQFAYVRSYVLENGHLFLATMADGSIIEFEPVPAE